MKRIYAIFFTLLLLLSNLGIALNTHICGSLIMDQTWSMGKQKLDCGMESENLVSHHEPTFSEEGHCCENQHEMLQLEDDFSSQKITISSIDLFISEPFTSEITLPLVRKNIISGEDRGPPFLTEKKQAFLQTFII